ncbi:MAG TPA: type II toxin-antitoxin system RelE/ParE family toxin [Pirellulales bacterium]|nr:type II toxin-antitoxin system RelE/ParE family toxin [Pirellulales bacterium]
MTAAAEAEIDASAVWWAERRSLDQALRWLREIKDRMISLAENPERCALARESSRFPFEIRELHFGAGSHPTHRASFRITGHVVEVLMVRHVAQDEVQPGDW